MRNKLLLIALPALMVMSSCTYMESATKVELFKEDTVLNEDLFGKLEPRNLGVPDVEPGSDSWTKAPKVGVQFKSYTEAEVDYLAVRFVAAIADTDGMTATWSRAVSEKDSNQIKAMAHDKVSTVRYDSLNDGGTPKAATTEGSGYEKYVVYSMYNIPAAQDESYIAAYLTLSKDGEEDVVSKVVITQLDGSHYFSLDASSLVKDGYFLQSSTAGIVKQKADADTDPSNAEKDNALFENVSFAAAEEFGLFRFTSSVFQFYGYSTFMSSTSASYIQAGVSDQYCKMYLAGQYTLYVNKDNLVYTQAKNVTTTLYFQPNDNWKTDSARFAAHVFHKENEVTTLAEWINLTETSSGSGIYKADIEIATHNFIIFCRMDPAKDNDWANKWNQTGDLGMPVDYGWLVGHSKYVLGDGVWDGNGDWAPLA